MDKEQLLKNLALKTMFTISDDEMDGFVSEYETFMKHVQKLQSIDTTGVEPMAYPYEIETSFMALDEAKNEITTQEALSNASSVENNQIKVPKVVG